MIKSKVIFAVSFVALFACGVARADIASKKYVNDNALDSVNVFNITDDRDSTVPYIEGGILYLPTAWGNQDEIDPGLAVLASSGEGYQFATDDYGYNAFSIAPTVDYMKDSIRNTFAQNAFLTSAQIDNMKTAYSRGTKVFILRDSARCFVVPVRQMTPAEESLVSQSFANCLSK